MNIEDQITKAVELLNGADTPMEKAITYLMEEAQRTVRSLQVRLEWIKDAHAGALRDLERGTSLSNECGIFQNAQQVESLNGKLHGLREALRAMLFQDKCMNGDGSITNQLTEAGLLKWVGF